jgi:glycosyltransferase involved in cell wall biosynthesis
MQGRIAVILKGFPRLSETFIAQELLGLERAGYRLDLYSMRHPTDVKRHPVHDEISAPVVYLPEYLHDEPVRVVKAWLKAHRLPGYLKALGAWLRDLPRDLSRNRVRRFGQALVLATEMQADTVHLHAHFIHTPGSVARYASLLTGLEWTCSAHAKDIWTSDESDLRSKLAAAQWVVTCTRSGWQYLRSLAARPQMVHLSYHGLDLKRFAPAERHGSLRDGSQAQAPVELLSVCRAVEKKGLDTLIDALAILPKDLSWRFTHIGAGDLVANFQQQAERLGIAQHTNWLGPRDQSEVLEAYGKSDIFVLPCRIAADGDRDGLPNVIVEALSQGMCCVSTNVSGVPELIEDGKNGLLVPPDDPQRLADALARLITDPSSRATMGSAGETRVRKDFDFHASIAKLSELFDAVLPACADARRTG